MLLASYQSGCRGNLVVKMALPKRSIDAWIDEENHLWEPLVQIEQIEAKDKHLLYPKIVNILESTAKTRNVLMKKNSKNS